MSKNKKTLSTGNKDQTPLELNEKQKRKERVFTSPAPSITLSIADAVVIKNEELFFLTKSDGSVPLEGKHGFGLYYHDCRYLDGYQVQIADADPTVLVSNADDGFAAVFELTNPEIMVSFNDYATQIFSGLSEASSHFTSDRLPELFCGFPYQDYHVPVRYPVACHPQAWTAGSLPFLTTAFLGLQPEGLEHRLRIVQPILPRDVDRILVRGLRVGGASADINFERVPGGQIAVNVTDLDGKLDVVLESE